MNREELINKCRYYKGEEECPEGHDWHPFVRFWNLERQYVCNEYGKPRGWFGKKFDEAHEMWETDGLAMCLDGSPQIEKFFNENEFDLFTRGMLSYMVIMSYDHDPMGGVDFILDYGK